MAQNAISKACKRYASQTINSVNHSNCNPFSGQDILSHIAHWSLLARVTPVLGGATYNSAAAGGAAVRASLTLRQEVG